MSEQYQFPAFHSPEEGELQTEVVYNAFVQRNNATRPEESHLPFWQEETNEIFRDNWRVSVNAGEQWRKDHEANNVN